MLRIAGASALVMIMPIGALAHTRWFSEPGLPPYTTTEPTGLYLALWAAIAAFVVLTAFVFERRGWLQLSFLQPRAGHAFFRAASVFSMVSGAFLMIAGTHGYLFSPNLTVASGIPQWMIYAQVMVGFLILIGLYARISSLVIVAIYLASIPITGFVIAIENIWVLTTALFIMIMGNDYFSIVPFRALGKHVQYLKPYALPLLRVGAGASLITLGFSEKILRPEFGVHFLEGHPWNFMQMMGFSYSDYLFTISAGAVEALLGLILVLGLVTRLNAIVIAIFFTIPLFILGPIELTGHVPHFAAIILLILFGAGPHLRLWGKRRP